MSKFQITVFAIFGILAVGAVLVFTGAIPMPGQDRQLQGDVEVWGTIPRSEIGDLLFQLRGDTNISVDYQQHDADTFEQELIEALAAGAGPDLFFLTQDSFEKHKNKAFVIPSDAYPVRDFQNTFLEEAVLFTDRQNVYALPFLIDPMVVYWNRELFSGAGVAQMPDTWEEFFSIVPRLTVASDSGAISQSAIALGEYENVSHAKEILALMILQTGNKIIEQNSRGEYAVTLGRTTRGGQVNPGESALRFYTEFANPTTPRYSWNRSLPESRNMFIQQDLAVYVGFASEYEELLRQNPRLDIGVAPIPTIGGDIRSRATFGRLTAVMISKASDNIPAAFHIARKMTQPEFLESLEEQTGLPPVRRDMLAEGTDDPRASVLYDSAVRARGWRDPNPERTEVIFRDMIRGVTSGRFRPSEAIRNGVRALEEITRQLNRQ